MPADLTSLKAKLQELEGCPEPHSEDPIPTTNYTTAYLRRPDDEDKYYAPTDDDYPFEEHEGYGTIVRAPPLPVPAANYNTLLFKEPGRMDEEIEKAKELIERRHHGYANCKRQEALCDGLRQEVEELRVQLSGLLVRCRVKAGHIERSFPVPHPNDNSDRLRDLPQLWKRDEDVTSEFSARVANLKKYTLLQRLKDTLASKEAMVQGMQTLKTQRSRLSHDCDEAMALIEHIEFTRSAVRVALGEGERSHEEEQVVYRLQRAAAADEERVKHHLPHMDRRADRAIAKSYAVSSNRLKEHLDCDGHLRMLRAQWEKVEAVEYGDIGEAQHAWLQLLEATTETRQAVRVTNQEREGRRLAAEARYEKIRDVTAQHAIQAIPLRPSPPPPKLLH